MRVIVYYQPVAKGGGYKPDDDSAIREIECDDWHQHFGCIHLMVDGFHRHVISLANVRRVEVFV